MKRFKFVNVLILSLMISGLVVITPVAKVSARGFSSGGRSFGGGTRSFGGSRGLGTSRSYTVKTTGRIGSRSNWSNSKLGTTVKVSGAYTKSGVTYYKSNRSISTSNFKTSTTKGYSANNLNAFNQFQYAKNVKATRFGGLYHSPYSYDTNQRLSQHTYHQTSWFGSPSFWASYWLFYPGTHGYASHNRYYQNQNHSSDDQRQDANTNVIDDQLHLLTAQTKQQFLNQDLAYQNTDLKPRVFITTQKMDNDTQLNRMALKELKTRKYAKQALNHNGVLILVTFNAATQQYQSVIQADAGLMKWISEHNLAHLNAKYQKQLQTSDVKKVNHTVQTMNQAVTKLMWQKYLKPNLKAHQAQVNANDSSNDQMSFGMGLFLILILAMVVILFIGILM